MDTPVITLLNGTHPEESSQTQPQAVLPSPRNSAIGITRRSHEESKKHRKAAAASRKVNRKSAQARKNHRQQSSRSKGK